MAHLNSSVTRSAGQSIPLREQAPLEAKKDAGTPAKIESRNANFTDVQQQKPQSRRGMIRLAIRHFFTKMFRPESLEINNPKEPSSISSIKDLAQGYAGRTMFALLAGKFDSKQFHQSLGEKSSKSELLSNTTTRTTYHQLYNDNFVTGFKDQLHNLDDGQVYQVYKRLHPPGANETQVRMEKKKSTLKPTGRYTVERTTGIREAVVSDLQRRGFRVPEGSNNTAQPSAQPLKTDDTAQPSAQPLMKSNNPYNVLEASTHFQG